MKIAHAANTQLGCIISDLHHHDWTACLRARAKEMRDKIALYGEEAAAYHVPYSQNKRNLGWKNYKITDLFDGGYFDCSSLCAAAAQRAGAELGLDKKNSPTTRTMEKAFVSSGCFDALKDDYLTETKKLMRGDILVAYDDHAVIILEDGEDIKNPYKVGKVYTTQVNLKVRKGPGLVYAQKLRSELTPDGQKHALIQARATFAAGTRITCKEVAEETDYIWIRCPSGWVCAVEGDRVYIK